MAKEDEGKIEEFRQRFGNKPPARRDQEAIERRRKNVWEMFLEGVPQTAMAKILNVSRMTIFSDLDVIQKRQQGYAHDLKHDQAAAEMDIGITIRKLETISESAMADYAAATTAQDKDRFLNTAMKAEVSRTRVLVDTGFLPKAGVDLKQTVEHTISFQDRFGKFGVMDDATARRKILAVAEAALKLGLSSTNDAKIIDVEAKVVNPTPEPPKP